MEQQVKFLLHNVRVRFEYKSALLLVKHASRFAWSPTMVWNLMQNVVSHPGSGATAIKGINMKLAIIF